MSYYIREYAQENNIIETWWVYDISDPDVEKQRTSDFDAALVFDTLEEAVEALSQLVNHPSNENNHGTDWWFEICEFKPVFSSVGIPE